MGSEVRSINEQSLLSVSGAVHILTLFYLFLPPYQLTLSLLSSLLCACFFFSVCSLLLSFYLLTHLSNSFFFFNFHKHCHLFPYLKKIYGLNFEVLRLDLCLEMGFRVLSLPFMFFSLLWPSKFGFDAPQKLILMFTCATRCFLMLPTFNPDFFFVLWCQKLLQSLM